MKMVKAMFNKRKTACMVMAIMAMLVFPASVLAVEVSITPDIPAADESGTNGRFTITQDSVDANDTTVNFTVTGTADGSLDYNTMPGSVTIPAGELSAYLDVSVVNDFIVEPVETVIVTLTGTDDPTDTLGMSVATVTIAEDPSDTASITIEDAEAYESEALSFVATLDNEVQGGLSVNVDFSDGSATGGTEYNNASQPLTFTGTAGETVTFTVGTIEDPDIESDETFTAALSGLVTTGGAPAGAIDDTDTATGTILNNDYEIAVSSGAEGTVSSGAVTAPPDAQLVVNRNDTPVFDVTVTDPVCFQIDTVTADGSAQSVPDGATTFSYTFLPVTADQSITATFGKQYEVTVTVLDESHGTASSTETVNCNSYTIDVEADEDYLISWVKLDGIELAGARDTKIFSHDLNDITQDHDVEVAFSQLIEIIEVSQFGEILPQGIGIPAVQLVHYGEDQSFAITAFADLDAPLGHNGHVHHISDILVDDTSIGTVQGTSLASDTYDFTNVTQDHTIEVLFTSYVDVSINGPGTISTSDGFSLTTTTTAEDSYEVESGATASFTITPADGYHVARMEIDGEVRGYASSWDFVDVVDEDHTLAVWFETDAFTLEPVSNFRTIFSDAALTIPAVAIAPLFQEDGTFYVKLSEPNNYDYTIAVVGLLVDNIHYTVPTAFDTTVTYPDTDPYFTLTRRRLNSPADASYAEYLEVTFTSVELSHRLEVLDYDTTPLADVPLDTRIQPQPAVIMFVMDNSGSMDWEFMTEESDGLFGGDYYLYETADRRYTGNVLTGDERKEWHSQWSGYNKMYYSPAITYTPWPTFFGHDLEDCDGDVTDRVANACLDLPRSHPWHNEGDAYKINMDNSWVDYSSGGSNYNTVITVDEVQSIPGANDHYTRTVTVANDDSRLRVWTTFTAQYTDMMARILDSSGNEYRYNEYVDSWTNPYGDGNHYDDDSSDRNPYIELENVPAGTYTLDFRAWGTDFGTFNLHVEVAEPQASTKDIVFAHYFVMHNEGETGEQLYLVNIKGPFDNMTDPVEYYLVNNYQVNTPYERIEEPDLVLITDLSTIPDDVTYYPPTGAGTPHEVYVAERQNFVNWFSYYRKRELAATAAIATFIKRVDNVMIGFNTINHHNESLEIAPRPVQVVENMQILNDRSEILRDLYSMVVHANGTPLRIGLRDVGRFYDTQVVSSLGTSPFVANVDGDECKQVFSIVMTDGYWNGGDPGVGDADGDNWSNSLADVAQYYYDIDLAPAVANEVPDPGNDRQHMTTYTVSFGVNGNLDPDVDTPPARDSSDWYAGTNNQDRIDDLWHAAVNGRGEYFSASNPERLVASLLYIMEDIMGGRVGSAASVSVNGDEFFQIIDNTVRVFQASYSSDYWTGDVRSFRFDVDTDGNFTGNRSLDWSAQTELTTVMGADGSGHTGRTIITYDPGTSNASGTVSGDGGASFAWTSLTLEQQLLLVPYWDRDRSAEDVFYYLRGSRNYVGIGDFRERLQGATYWDQTAQEIVHDGDNLEEAWFGDFVNSRPLFANDVLYVGGNDGMLHAFATTGTDAGREIFAYIPNLVFDNLRELPDPVYEHKFFVDGGMVKHEVGNQVYLVGGLGKGGKGYYCLNITSAESVTSVADAAALIQWEYPKPVPTSMILTGSSFTFSQGTGTDGNDRIQDSANGFTAFAVGDYIKVVGTVDSIRELTNDGIYEVLRVDNSGGWIDVEAGSLAVGCGNNQDIIIRKTTSDPDMGYSYGKPVVVKSNSAAYPDIAILANGYGSENGTASLKILDLTTGELIRTLDTGRGPFNGLSTPKAIDVDNDLMVDYVYAGDLRGSMWKFDLTDSNVDNWQIAYCQNPDTTDHCLDLSTVPEPLFTAGAHQAITAAPDITNQQDYKGYIVVFGTGRYLGMTDLDSVDIQSVYGLWDWAPDDYDEGYLGTRIDNISVTPPVAELSNWTETDVGGNMINTLLRQELWCEGELTIDSGTGYYRVPSNFEGDWSTTPTDELDSTHPAFGEQTDTGDFFNVPSANLGWYFDLPGKLTDNALNNNAAFTCCDFEPIVDGMGQPLLDSQGEAIWQCASPIAAPGGRDLGERVTSDTIIRNNRAITVSFMREGSRCSGGLYSFLNERDANNGGMGYSPVLDVNGGGAVGQDDNPVDPATDSVIDISLIATDVGRSGHLYNPVIIKDEEDGEGPTEQKYMSSSRETIEVVRETAEVEGIYFWKQIE